MNSRSTHTHVIDAIFPIAVFFVFAASSLAVFMLSARIYDSTSSSATGNYSSRTAFAYIQEKVRQHDSNGGISAETIDGIDYLLLKDEDYTTYIYAYDGMLKELRLRDGVKASPESGLDITPVEDFSIGQTEEQLYHFDITVKDGNTFSIAVSERSVQ